MSAGGAAQKPHLQARPRSRDRLAEPALHGDEYLTMRLRDFLHSPATQPAPASAVPHAIPEEVAVEHEPARVGGSTSQRAPTGYVWVDCFFYGFFLEESKAREAGMLPPDASSGSAAVHLPAVAAC
jgi:hypothetical protein